MNNSSIFKGVATASIALILVLASRGASISEDEDLTSLQDADDATYLTIQQGSIEEPVEMSDPLPSSLSLIIPFNLGQEDLSQDNLAQIKEIAEYLIKTGKTFEIQGCTDSVGTEDENYWISHRRAQNVLDALEKFGVPVIRYMDESMLYALKESGEDVSRYYNDQGNIIIGQDGDVYGLGEVCPSLVAGESDNQEQRRTVRIEFDPEY